MSKQSTNKIIFSGPVGAGKTTAINSISDIETVRTEELATDETKKLKANTTVAMDYGAIVLEDKTRIHLYGTPGQKRFDFMWEILSKGGIGLLLLIDGSDPKALEYLRMFLKSFEQFIDETCVVVGITKQENRHYEIDDYCQVAKNEQFIIPIFEVDARERADVVMMVEALLLCLNPKTSG